MNEYAGIALIPIVVGLTEIVKRLGLKDRLCPIVSLVLGLGIGMVYGNGDIKQGILQGIYYGLSASGLYSGVKNVVEEFNIL